MQAKREFRDRTEPQVAVLDALVERHEEGMTVFELRSSIDHGIDHIETALGELQEENLIRVEGGDGSTRIYPDERVIPSEEEEEPEPSSFADSLREKLPF